MPSHNSQKPGATNPRVNSERGSYGLALEEFNVSTVTERRIVRIVGAEAKYSYPSDSHHPNAVIFSVRISSPTFVRMVFSNALSSTACNNDKIIAFSSSFVDTSNITSFAPGIALDGSLIREAEDALLGTYSLTLVVQVKDNHITRGTKQSLMPVDAHSDEILSVTDRAAQPNVRPTSYSLTRELRKETFVDPKDLLSSPSGWGANTQIVPSQSATTSQSSTATFDFDDTVLVPSGGSNFDATRHTALYITNEVHDYAYKYGWTTVSYDSCIDETAA
ncbi:uncharacterized protein ARMOST_21461 [Armillaria ostoyae]|uniref:Extracellular metalloproteinase n=1 Tax=Armillaria ostoyae TaxID=47428 RepID=A0A284SA62_ARMOS|nr:uncharacterized protein ARMOST_21461 [Armillaria ostoyae]